MLTRIHQKLEADSNSQRQKQDFARGSKKRIFKGNEKSDKDADEQHHKHEACSAAGMKTALFFDIFHRQLLAFFIAENRFMLCPMIFKGSADIRHQRNQHHISDKYQNFQYTLNDAFP